MQMRRRLTAILSAMAAVVVAAAGLAAPVALADGDPGSDVLIYQSLFVLPDAGISAQQQVTLGNMLQSAAKANSPIRVAVIAGPSDLGAVTAAWRKPKQYARFLGYELSLAYKGQLLIVMPDGYGFNWPGHPTAAAYAALSSLPLPGHNLAQATTNGIRALAALDHIPVSTASSSAPTAPPAGASSPGAASSVPSASHSTRTLAFALLIALAVAVLVGRLAWARRDAVVSRLHERSPPRPIVAAATVLPLSAAAILFLALHGSSSSPGPGRALASNPVLDGGTVINTPAPNFTLTNQQGRRISLRQFRGKVVILSFNDSECTTVCPLTTTAMLDAKAMLGPAAANVQLLGVDANPRSTSIQDVQSYTQLHGMLGAWDFLTGDLRQLRRVWKKYSIDTEITRGLVDHTPAVFMINPAGRIYKLFLTQESYAAVPQLGQVLATNAAQLLPNHPPVLSHLNYAHITGIPPTRPATLPDSKRGHVTLGPGKARLVLFFDTWDRQVTDLAGGLTQLGAYQTLARQKGLPPLTAVDEASVEPTGMLNLFMRSLRKPPNFPVALDSTGRLADGYEVTSEPSLVLLDQNGHIAMDQSLKGLHWPTPEQLAAEVKHALAHVPTTPGSTAHELAGSPAPLAALHHQASQLLSGGYPALLRRLHSLLGHPVVLNVWASWCPPCQAEFKLFTTASARYGKQVAFVGINTADSPGNARNFLAQNHVSYPSYAIANNGVLSPMAQLGNFLPDTIFISPNGHIVHVETGQYNTQGTLDNDITTYAYRTH